MTANTEQEREEFEVVASDNGKWPKAIERDAKGDYILMQTANGWMWWQQAWQAARRAQVAHKDIEELEHTRREAENLAWSLFNKHYASDEEYASGRVEFGLCDSLRGVLSQIDNMTTGLARAPAVPQGWKLVPVEPTDEMISEARKEQTPGDRALRLWARLLAAAPQPPESNSAEFDRIKTETAPVQMPEPAAVAFRFETEEDGPTETSFYPSERIGMGMGWTALYTEHQVRQLLAAYGITQEQLG